ncbi:hypothetical protein IU500_12350 [Nocardia terpenica]|uniref:hypothetical protein n=1 Tax=Nocardia terpenica TaxID=455432 RepID=UPI001894A340|nr:hypothetical protein [Nocardia terpenica]MBF6063032.1 hypothetical protein [Nocardia terpenica]MBF6104833.1 hypothetical protein [Nocardia terpenica]MBF6112731.1 hypothetical protein [Nocardia terpenica]MBF6118561.1 hypothetical protein [Nocardia terpenica]MBF6155040.1 hypothetical protein [Nocardia terpenica]
MAEHCVMPHLRYRQPGERYSVHGRLLTALGGENIIDHRGEHPVHRSGSHFCHDHSSLAASIIEQTPDVVAWLRLCATASASTGFDSPASRAQCGSRPPCDVVAIDAADQELEALAYWAWIAGLEPIPGPVHRVRGRVRGLARGDLGPVVKISAWMSAELGRIEEHDWAGDMLTDLMNVRARHLTRWPLTTTSSDDGRGGEH